jgi:Flp pilus assembly protein TadG
VVKRLPDESGQTIILAALCFSLLLGFVALAVDVGLMFNAKRISQTAADSAAVAGAQEVNYGDATAAAKADAARNGVTAGANGATVAVNSPPLKGPNAGKLGYVEVIVSQSQPTFFMKVFNRKTMLVSGRSVAVLGTTHNCIYGLNPSGTDITLTGGTNVQSTSCALYGNSSSSAAFSISGGSTLKAQAINLVGGYSNTGGSTLTPTPTTGIANVSDPLAYLPAPTFTQGSCLADPNPPSYPKPGPIGPTVSGGTVCYKGLTVGNGISLTLKAGLYIINGALSVGGGTTVTGAGVTFYFPVGGSVSMGNGAVINLTAPTSGTYDGILIYQNRSNPNPLSIVGGANSVLSGIIYCPGANLTLNNGTTTSIYASIIAGSLTFAGGATLKNYADINSSTPLSSARLVE